MSLSLALTVLFFQESVCLSVSSLRVEMVESVSLLAGDLGLLQGQGWRLWHCNTQQRFCFALIDSGASSRLVGTSVLRLKFSSSNFRENKLGLCG